MEPPIQLSWCSLCCSSYYPVKTEEEDEESGQSPQLNYFNSFLTEIELLGKATSVTERTVCSVCFGGIRQAMRTREEMRVIEGQVRELQRQILEAMRQVELVVDRYQKDMRGIQEVVEACGGKVEYSGEQQSNKRKYKRDVLEFRRRIVDVAGSLTKFKAELSTRNMNKVTTTTCRTSKIRTYSSREDVISPFPEEHSDTDDESDEDFQVPADEADEESYDDDDHLGIQEDNCDLNSIKVKGEKRSGSKPGNDDTDNLKDSDPVVDGVLNPPVSPDQKPCSEASNKRKRDKDVSDNGINFLIKDKGKLLRQISAKYNIKLTGMSKWKRALLTNLLQTVKNLTIPTRLPDGEIKACKPPKPFDIKYDNSTGQLIFAGYPITLEENDQKVLCGHCGFIVNSGQSSTATPKYIIQHILGNHLGTYTCEVCGACYKSCNKYRVHLNSHKQAFTCKICGKPLSTPEYVRTHLWTHMSTEEQEEAVRNGEVDRRKHWHNHKYKEKTYVCSICGVSFKTPQQLKSHDQVHVDVEEREKFLCPHCGKMFLRSDSLQKHLEKSCVIHRSKEELSRRLPCDLCSNTFKRKSSLKNHKRTVHGVRNGKVFRCSLCHEEFSTKISFLVHTRKVHEGKSVWVCMRNGCGKEFIKKSKLLKHQERRNCVPTVINKVDS